MDKALVKINELNFEIDRLKIQKQMKKRQYTKLDKETLELNFKIISLHNEINRLKQQKIQVENSKTLLNQKKEDAKFNTAFFSILLISISTIFSWFAHKDILAVIIALIFGGVVVIPASATINFSNYFKLKQEIKKINLNQINLDIVTKQKTLDIADTEYDIKEKEMIELKTVIEEIEKQIIKLVEEKDKIEKLRNEAIQNRCDITQSKEENEIKSGKHKVLIFKNRKNGVDVDG
ncbi:MAG: hypothetical protein IJY25_03350 [Bacilli bacterium]|nr:hypothetical protein [Bacilli bacterium]